MTTERSGMSLEQISRALRAEACNSNAHTFKWLQTLADAIDAHLSRDAVVSDEDVERACAAYLDGWRGKTDLDGDLFRIQMRAALSSFASRRSAVPDAKVIPHGNVSFNELSPLMCIERAEAIGWNACREAMLAQRDGGY